MKSRPWQVKSVCKRGHHRTEKGKACKQCAAERMDSIKTDPEAHEAYLKSRRAQHKRRYAKPKWREKFLAAVKKAQKKRRKENQEVREKMFERLKTLRDLYPQKSKREMRKQKRDESIAAMLSKAEALAYEARYGIERVAYA